jgi:cytidylate kinase
MARSEAPLRPADTATVIDTSDLSIEQAVATALAAVQAGREAEHN